MDPARRKILNQTLLQLVVWLIICLVAIYYWAPSIIFFSVGICFILPMHSVRLGRLLARRPSDKISD